MVEGFRRRLVEEGQRIESVCVHCGFVILSSVSEGISQREMDHALECFLARNTAASSKAAS
jgi:hypothetical protein